MMAGMEAHLVGLAGDWALWRDLAVRSAGFSVSGLDAFGAGDEGARLSEIAADPLFREAVIWQNRLAFETQVAKIAGLPTQRGSKRRQREAVVASYWQRYCSKNDTIGFFGPLAWGEIVDHGPALTVRSGQLVARREVHFETWAVAALARALGVAVPLTPRLHPERELRPRLGGLADPAARERGLEGLRRLEAARDVVAGAHGDELLAALEAFDGVFSEVTGQGALRPDDDLAAGGRTPLYLDCLRDLEVDIGPALVGELAQGLPPLLESARWYCGRVFQLGQDIIAQEMGTGAGAQDLAPIHQRLMSALMDLPRRLRPALEELQSRWADLLASPDRATLPGRVTAAFSDDEPAWPTAVYHSPDVQIAARSVEDIRRGRFLAVVGDFHPGGNALLQGVFATQHPNPERLRDNARSDLGSPRLVPIPRRAPGIPLNARVAPALISPEDLHVAITADDRPPEGYRCILLSDIVAVDGDCTDRQASFRAPLAHLLYLPIFLAAMRTFDPFPVSGTHGDRITIGRTVLRRETWAAPAGEIPSGPDDFAPWARARGMPRRLFCRPPGEEKPVYVDLESPLLTKALSRMLRRSAESQPQAQVNFTEMLPGPADCWLEHERARYTSELRLIVVDLSRRGAGRVPTRARAE
jgi:hypothetical protein